MSGLLLAAVLATAPIGEAWKPYGPAHADAPVAMLYGSAPDEPDSALQGIVDDVVGNLSGDYGVAVKKLDTGQYAEFNGDKQQVSASLYKLWVLNELYHQAAQGKLGLNDQQSVTGDDAAYDASQDDLRLNVGDGLTLLRAAYLMITVSDNTSAHLLVRVLGANNVEAYMQQEGLTHSLLDWEGSSDNLTTPLDMLREMELIATSQMVDAGSSAQMVSMMLDQQINDLIPPGLPDGTRFAHKTGALDSLMHDAGIVYGPSGPFVIVVLASNIDSYDTVYTAMHELARRVYAYFNDAPSSPVLYFPETRQTVGHDFLKFWNLYGGVPIFGYPIGPEQMRGGLLVQDFERGRFELHPENSGSSDPVPEVGLGLVGQERAAQLGLSWPRGQDSGHGRYFEATGQEIAPEFYDFWVNHGGDRIFGLPLSPAQDLQDPSDGQTYFTQWFQRARMEIRSGLPDGQKIVLDSLGSALLGSGK